MKEDYAKVTSLVLSTVVKTKITDIPNDMGMVQ